MSYDELEAALRKYVQDTYGTYLTDWTISLASIFPDDPDAVQYGYISAKTQSLHNTLGLLGLADRWYTWDAQGAHEQQGDDDG